MTTKVNKKESANKVANNVKIAKVENATKVANVTKTKNIESIITKFNENTKGLLSTNLGNKKSSLYKENLFVELNEKEKKSLRKKLRNMIFSAAKSLVNETNKDNKQKLINAFNELYNEIYKVNDYTLQSVCNENLSKEKKDILLKSLEICKPKK